MIPAYYATRCGRYVAHVVSHERVADLLTVEEAEARLASAKHATSDSLSAGNSLVFRNNMSLAGDLTVAMRIVRNLKLQRAA